MGNEADTSNKSDILDFMRNHIKQYIETDGAEGHLMNGSPCLVLTTVGKKSGEARQAAVIYGQYKDSYVVVASKGGSPTSPAWFYNMMANDSVQIQVLAEKMTVTPRIASGDEREKLWELMADIFPDYNDYQKLTTREIPVVVLDK